MGSLRNGRRSTDRPAFGGKKNLKNIALEDLEFVGRKRNRIHLVLNGTSSFYYFSCSRLHDEDMCNQLLARLDELGMEVTSHERNR